MVKSQRLFFVILVALSFGLVGTFAFTSGHPLLIEGADLNSRLTSVVTPFLAILAVVMSFLKVVNARVASGLLPAGDIIGMASLSEFWVSVIAIISGELQIFGFEVLTPETQTLVVNIGMGLIFTLLSALSDRAPADPIPTEQRAQMVNPPLRE